MEILSIQELIELACVRYGQLLTSLDIYKLGVDTLEILLKDVVEEYTQYIPMTKELSINASPQGTFLGNDVISVRNVRMNNFYFSRLSPRMDRRQRKFNAHTKMLYMPLSMPVVVECGVMYPVGRIKVTDEVDKALVGDKVIKFKLNNYRYNTLSITIGDRSWNDFSIEYPEDNSHSCNTNDECNCNCGCSSIVTLEASAQDIGIATYDTKANILRIKDLNITEDTPVVVQYNTDKAVVQGLGLRDKLFVDLFIGRLMLALGNEKATLVMEGDVIGFANDDLMTQGQNLVDTTLDLLMSSSTSYKIL